MNCRPPPLIGSSCPGFQLALGWLLAGLFLLPPAPAAAQEATASLLVRVIAAADSQPLSGAQVHLNGAEFRGSTDEGGRLRITGLHPGPAVLEIRLLGYETLQLHAELKAGGEHSLTFPLAVRPVPLEGVRVQGRAGARAEFFERMKRGTGHFITREEIERARPRRFSDLLRMVPGMRLTCVGLMDTCGAQREAASPAFAPDMPVRRTSRADNSCPLQYFVDGVYQPQGDVNLLRPEDVEAVEVYKRFADAPARYSRGANTRCGVILVWMRRSLGSR